MIVDWETLFGLIDPSLFVVVAACWALGYILKQTPRVPDWTIVYIVTVAAVAVVVAMQGLTVQAVIQGVLCGAFAVYGHQVVKQTRERE
jgi:4-hydroxybenzoate polyprenyltransferase